MASPSEPAQPPGPGYDAEILRERDRIAAELQNEVIQRIFAIGLDLQGTAAITADPLVRRRVEQTVTDLDHVVQFIRGAVFHLQARFLKDRGLRAGVVHLGEQLSPVPEVTFHGPVDGALHPAAAAELLDILGEALTVIGQHWAPAAIEITAADGVHVTTVRAVPLPDAAGPEGADYEFPGLRERAAQAGMRIDIEPGPQFVQISWHAA
jgi:two-component system, NarL family, sensor histidine kinase DevS